MDDRRHLLGDRQLHPVLLRERERAAYREDALRDPWQTRCDILPGHARAQQLTGPPISRERAHAGCDQVADPCQA